MTATRAMATEGKQQSTSNGIDKDGWWLAREHCQGNHTSMTVGDDKRQERAVDDDALSLLANLKETRKVK